MMDQQAVDSTSSASKEEKERQFHSFLHLVTPHLGRERMTMLDEMQSLTKNVDHVKTIIAMQQSYAGAAGLVETISVADLVDDALKLNTSSMEHHRIVLVREYTDMPPVELEKQKVLQVLVNLLRNARDSLVESSPDQRQLTVRIKHGGSLGDRKIVIEVIDNGVGIAKENLTRIFSHGFTTKKQGHGFGLHSSANVAKEMGGSLTASSDGPGSRRDLHLATSVQACGDIDMSESESIRILVIDDQESIHDDFRKIIVAKPDDLMLNEAAAALFGEKVSESEPSESFEIDSARQGEEGLALVERSLREQRPYPLAFVDVRMPPGWDGVETVHRIWQVDPNILIVLCTAYSDHSWEEIVMRLGRTDHLLILKKPFDSIEVRQMVLALSKRWNLARQAEMNQKQLEEKVVQRTDRSPTSQPGFGTGHRGSPVQQREARRRPSRGGGGQPGQVRLPRQHESRNPHAHDFHHRLRRTPAKGHRSIEGAGPEHGVRRRHCPKCQTPAANHQRYLGSIQDRKQQTRS